MKNSMSTSKHNRHEQGAQIVAYILYVKVTNTPNRAYPRSEFSFNLRLHELPNWPITELAKYGQNTQHPKLWGNTVSAARLLASGCR